jgi:hypothetical protein
MQTQSPPDDARITSAQRRGPLGRASRPLSADAIGCRVARTRGRYGRVDAVFNNACNLAMDDGALVTVLAPQAGNVAHGIRLISRFPHDKGLKIGMAIYLDAQNLVFGDASIEVLLSTARVWAPELRAGLCDWQRHARNAALFVRDLLYRHCRQSGSEFLQTVLGLAQPATPLSLKVSAVLRQLRFAVDAGDRACALNAVAKLVGLGPGLTPAGDDFIIGWLAGLALQANSRTELELLQAMCIGIEQLRHATTSVSSQHLDDACALMFSERLSDLCVAIARGAPPTALDMRLRAQLAVGATSGADAAAGLMFALFHRTSIDRQT